MLTVQFQPKYFLLIQVIVRDQSRHHAIILRYGSVEILLFHEAYLKRHKVTKLKRMARDYINLSLVLFNKLYWEYKGQYISKIVKKRS